MRCIRVPHLRWEVEIAISEHIIEVSHVERVPELTPSRNNTVTLEITLEATFHCCGGTPTAQRAFGTTVMRRKCTNWALRAGYGGWRGNEMPWRTCFTLEETVLKIARLAWCARFSASFNYTLDRNMLHH